LNRGAGALLAARERPGTLTETSAAPRSSATVSPNPFNPEAILSFSTREAGSVRIGLYDVNGRFVRRLLEEPTLASGDHRIRIDGRDAGGRKLASGVYFYRIQAGTEVIRGRVSIVK
jgi:hypothetical protein